jgi:UPF0755 protein
MTRVIVGLFALLVAGCLVAAAAGYWAYDRFQAPGPAPSEITVIVPRGASLAAIGRQLYEAGVVENAQLFRFGSRLLARGQTLKAGEYAFAAHVSAMEAMRQMIEGRTVAHKLTVAEGLTVAEALALVGAGEGLEGELPAEAAWPGEGSLLPETYLYNRGDSRAEVIARMAEAMQKTLAELWAARAPDLPLKTPEAALILASVVEKETGVGTERARIARVFLNRLGLGMPLQSDPTVIYALTQGRTELGRELTRADLGTPSPYNSYLNPGLPPGPISNPGRDAIEAVLHPSSGNDLYFVADGTGGHAFAATLAEHNRNVAKWRQINSQ